jgi:general secretion pathway protein B
MSYILDALRKSDQQRQHGATPTLLTAHGIAAAPKRAGFLPYGVLAVLLLAAGVAIGWLRPWQGGPQDPAAAVVPNRPPPAQIANAPAPVAPQWEKEIGLQQPAIQAAPVTPTGVAAGAPGTVKQVLPAVAATGTREPSGPALAVVARDGTGTAAAKTPAAPMPVAAPPEKTVMNATDLPPTIQQEIPRMAISVHAYSATPANRLVGINDQLLREGDSLAQGIRLEEITEDGMVFSYKGYRFRTGTRGWK